MSVWDHFVTGILLFVWVALGVVIATASAPTTNMVNSNHVFGTAGDHNYTYVMSFIPQMDYVFAFLYLGMNIAVLVRAAYLKSEWSDYVIAWFASFLIVFASFYESNVYVSVFRSAALASGVGMFKNSIYIIQMLPVYNAIFLGLYSVVLLVSLRGGIELPLKNYVTG